MFDTRLHQCKHRFFGYRIVAESFDLRIVSVSYVHSSSTVFPEFVSPDLQEKEWEDEDPLSLNGRRFSQTCSDGNNARGSRVLCSVLNVPRSRHWFSDRYSDDPSSGTNRGLIFDLILDTWCLILEMGSDMGWYLQNRESIEKRGKYGIWYLVVTGSNRAFVRRIIIVETIATRPMAGRTGVAEPQRQLLQQHELW